MAEGRTAVDRPVYHPYAPFRTVVFIPSPGGCDSGWWLHLGPEELTHLQSFLWDRQRSLLCIVIHPFQLCTPAPFYCTSINADIITLIISLKYIYIILALNDMYPLLIFMDSLTFSNSNITEEYIYILYV